jgi:autotransporter adhesin
MLESAVTSVSGATASGTDSAAYGQGAVASGDNSTSVGVNATASSANSSAYGSGASATAENSVALGASSIADRANTISVGSTGSERQIANVADGTAGTDAVNLRQLNRVGAMAAALATSNPHQYDPDAKGQLTIGTAFYGDELAFALGYDSLC